jgi:hypothetical protein
LRARAKRSMNGASLNSIVRLAANFGIRGMNFIFSVFEC